MQADPANRPDADRDFAVVSSCETRPRSATSDPPYPLKKAANGRYLVDQKDLPFLIAGDSPQAMMVNLSGADADFDILRQFGTHGFNTVWIILSAGREPEAATMGALSMEFRPSLNRTISPAPMRPISPVATG